MWTIHHGFLLHCAGLLLFVMPLLYSQTCRAGDLESVRAHKLLLSLRGEWTFEIHAANQPDTVTHKGYRVFKETHNAFALSWEENIQGSGLSVKGILGYDRTRDEFYEFGLATAGAGEYSAGTWDSNRDAVTFYRVTSDGITGNTRTILQPVNSSRFLYLHVESDHDVDRERWRAVFTRMTAREKQYSGGRTK